jgi:hypothetical protein
MNKLLERELNSNLKIPVRIGYQEMPSLKGPIKDQRLLVAYAVATSGNDFGVKSSSRNPNSSDGEGFIAVIKNFFKQLIP